MPKQALVTNSASPLYVQLMERIRTEIRQGVYPTGDRIPTEHELEVRYSVSRVTVRRALQELTDAGLLERKQGKGTFVAMPKPEAAERRLRSFHEACRDEGRKPSVTRVRARETDASEEDRRRLALGPEASVLEIRRVLRADGIPVILENSRFSAAYTWLENANLNGSLYMALQEYGIRAEKGIYDLSLARASEEEAELLQIPEGTTLLEARQLVYDQKGRPLYTSRQLIRADLFPLKI